MLSDQEKEIITERIFDVSIDDAFKAWSDPEILKTWWGPAGFTNTFHEFNFRPGGIWKFVMHGPDKGHYPNECEFTTIDPPNLITWKRHSKPLFRVQADFLESGLVKTKITFRQIFETAEECNKMRKFVVEKNEENFDRLALALKKQV